MTFQSAISIAPRLSEQAMLSVTQPLSKPVISNDHDYLLHAGVRKLGWRQIRRALYFKFSGQERYCRTQISPEWKRALWLYKGIPQIGDALMDLAPRSLLAQRGITVDLYTDRHIAELFAGDPWFEKVFSSPVGMESLHYDFVIVPSFKRRSLKEKICLLPKTPWITVHGFYTGPEFHRGEFATQRLLDALDQETGLTPSSQLVEHARQKLKALPCVGTDSPRARLKVAFALGGVDPLRTYRRWTSLAIELEKRTELEITLVGSANGIEDAQAFARQWHGRLNNLVGKTDLLQCRQLISEQDVLVACDGGLMHLAATTSVRLISLFTSAVDPAWRLCGVTRDNALQSANPDVNFIEAETIVRKVMEAGSRRQISNTTRSLCKWPA